MQNKLYTIQFFSPPNNQLHSQSLSSDHWAHRFHRTCGKWIQTHRKRVPAPQANPHL